MHIVHVGKYYPPYRGGIETVVEQLCRGLVERGEQVTAVVSNDGPATIEETLHGVHVVRLGTRLLVNSQPLSFRLVRSLRALTFDLLHFHTPNPVGALAILRAGVVQPIVVTHHSDIIRQRLLGKPATLAHALLYRKAAALVAATPKHVQHSNVLRHYAKKCHVIHFPIDAAPYESNDDSWDEGLPASWQREPLILFVGRLVYYKGVSVLLNALHATRGGRLAIVGEGPLEGELKAQARDLRLGDRVVFLGEVSERRLRALYKHCRFLVLPSIARSEAFGMVQLEAMAAGRPVISTDLRSGVPYVNQHEVTGLVVPPSNALALSVAMNRMLDDHNATEALARAAKARVLAEFNVPGVIEAHLALYRSLTSHSNND